MRSEDNPLALSSKNLQPGDRLVLVLRSLAWDAAAVEDIKKALAEVGITYAILYLDANDEAHVIRGAL